jgi:hypothetical protein
MTAVLAAERMEASTTAIAERKTDACLTRTLQAAALAPTR